VACPFFDPTLEAWDDHAIAHRLPLGQAYRGICAITGQPPAPETQIHICNEGYARGRCAQFPTSEPVDAIRFSGHLAPLTWIEEADHRPLRFGTWDGTPEGSPHNRKALAFRHSIDLGKIR